MKLSHNSILLFLFTLGTLFLLQYVFDVKSYIITILCYGFLVFILLKRSLAETFFYLLLITIPIEKGIRDWTITIVPNGIESWMQGYSLYVGFTLKLIFTITIIALLLTKKSRLFIHPQKNLIIFIFFVSLSTLMAIESSLAFVGYIRIVLGICLYLIGEYMYYHVKQKRDIVYILLALLLFFGFIGIRQQLHAQPLGLFLEDSASFRPFGYTTTDGDPLYRVSGFTGHPTFFGSFLSLLFPVGVGLFLEAQKNKNKRLFYVSLFVIILSCVSIISTQSRSSWIAVAMITLFFIVMAIRKKEKHAIKFLSLGASIIAMIAIFIAPTVLNRLASIPDVWTTGSGNVRLLLIQQAWEIILAYPIFGVGLNHFVRIMSSHELPVNLQGFMFPVHNTFLLFFSELGIPAGIAFLWFSMSIMYKAFNRARKNWVTLGIWLGAFTFFINAQFHTLFNQDPTFDVFMLLLGIISAI